MKLSSPVYEIPVDDDTLVAVGRIVAMFAQIDFQINSMLRIFGNLTIDEFDHLFSRKTIGPKLDTLGIYSKKFDEPIKKKIIKVKSEIRNCVKVRNVIIHGMWGVKFSSKTSMYEPVMWGDRKGDLFWASEIGVFHEKVLSASLICNALYVEVSNSPAEYMTNRNIAFFIADHPPKKPPNELKRSGKFPR